MRKLVNIIKIISKTSMTMYFFVGILLSSMLVFATVTVLTNAYIVSANSTGNTMTGFIGTECASVANNFSNDIFIPKRTAMEWNSFKTKSTLQISVSIEPNLCGSPGPGLCTNGMMPGNIFCGGTVLSWTCPSICGMTVSCNGGTSSC